METALYYFSLKSFIGQQYIRKIKVKQKVSGCFRTEKGANTFMNVHSVAETAKKNGNSKYKAILAVLEQ